MFSIIIWSCFEYFKGFIGGTQICFFLIDNNVIGITCFFFYIIRYYVHIFVNAWGLPLPFTCTHTTFLLQYFYSFTDQNNNNNLRIMRVRHNAFNEHRTVSRLNSQFYHQHRLVKITFTLYSEYSYYIWTDMGKN